MSTAAAGGRRHRGAGHTLHLRRLPVVAGAGSSSTTTGAPGGRRSLSEAATLHRAPSPSGSARYASRRTGLAIPGLGGVSTYVSLPVSGDRAYIGVRAGGHRVRQLRLHRRAAGGGRRSSSGCRCSSSCLGIPTTIAIGTDLFQIIITVLQWGPAFAYALSDRVDPTMAALMLAAASSRLAGLGGQRYLAASIRRASASSTAC